MKIATTLSSVGAVAGIYYGVKNHKSFWTTLGFTLLFSIGGAAVGTVITSITNND